MAVSIEDITDLGDILGESMELNNNLLKVSLPSITGGSSENTSVINIMGKTREITLTGRFVGTNSAIGAFITEVEAWTNSGRQSSKTYTSAYGKTYSVLAQTFRYDATSDTPTFLPYTITMIQGSTLGLITGT